LTAGLALAPAAGCMPDFLTSTANKRPVSESPVNGRAERNLPGDKTAEIFIGTAQGLEKQGDLSRAAACYEQAMVLDPTVSDRLAHHLAILYDKTGEPGKAVAAFQRALKVSPKDADLLNDLGYHWYNCGNWSEAELHLRDALSVDSKHARARMNLGLTLAQQGRDQEALDAFRHIIGPAEAQCNLGFVLSTQGRHAEARSAYGLALSMDPSCKLAQLALSKLATGQPGAEDLRELAPTAATEPVTP
jgi:Tfp pilus assembly protein PilF